MGDLARVFARGLVAAALALAPTGHVAGEEVHIELAAPADGGPGAGRGMGFLAGRVSRSSDETDLTDLVFVVDVSDSTSVASGGDIDGDGKSRGGEYWRRRNNYAGQLINIGGWLDDTTDTVLAAELAAVRNLLDQLDPRRTRVGVITFSGDKDPSSLDADVIAPLTSDYAEVRRVLDAEQKLGADGRTNLSAGISLAIVELSGTRSAKSEPRKDVRKLMLLFSDGNPTLPLDADSRGNAKLAVQAAERAARSGIRIQTYGVGPNIGERYMTEIARVTQGTYTPVADPSALRAEVAKVSLIEVGELEIENLATGARALRSVRSPDGNFFALLRMQPGLNPVRVRTTTSQGSGEQRFDVEFREDSDVAAGAPQDPTEARMRRDLFSGWLAEQTPPSADAPARDRRP